MPIEELVKAADFFRNERFVLVVLPSSDHSFIYEVEDIALLYEGIKFAYMDITKKVIWGTKDRPYESLANPYVHIFIKHTTPDFPTRFPALIVKNSNLDSEVKYLGVNGVDSKEYFLAVMSECFWPVSYDEAAK